MNDIVKTQTKWEKGWTGGLPETPCGSGSKLVNTKTQREWLPRMWKKYGVRTIADVGAGDLNWIKEMDMTAYKYMPFDLVPRHPSVSEFNLIEQKPPAVDCVLCLWVLNHLPLHDAQRAWDNLWSCNSRYLIITHRERWASEHPFLDRPCLENVALNGKGDTLRLFNMEARRRRRWQQVEAWLLSAWGGQNQPAVGVEVGVKQGLFTAYLCSRFPALRMIAVDPWEVQPAGNETYSGWGMAEKYAEFKRRVKPYGDRVTECRMYSVEAAAAVDGPLDLVFIDAQHDYESCRADVEAWLPKLGPGGLLCGHDYDVKFPGVMRAVDEAEARHGLKVFCGDDSTWGAWVP
jgi:hypothetical protein